MSPYLALNYYLKPSVEVIKPYKSTICINFEIKKKENI